MDFFARQEAARRATRWLLVVFLLCVALVTLAVGAVVYSAVANVGGPESPNRDAAIVPAALAAFAALLVISCASLYKTLTLRGGGGVVARSLGGTRVGRGTGDLALKRLHNVVEEMAIASGVSMPEVYVLENEDGINAFAAGNSPADAAIAVTRGAITRLNREELQGVIAHEYSHVLNGDMRLNSRLMGWVFGLLIVAIAMRLFLQSGAARGSSRRDGKGGMLVLIAVTIMAIGYIGVFVGRILQAAVSRHRERLADASAVQFTRNPGGLKGALLKIAGVDSGSALVTPDREEVAHMLFAPGMSRLFATHPSLLERVRALDPGVAREEFNSLAAQAGRQAELMRVSPLAAEMAGGAQGGGVAPQAVAANQASQVAALAGTFDEMQQRYAQGARRELPEQWGALADSPDAARGLMFALLAGNDDVTESRQQQVLTRVYGAGVAEQVRAFLPLTRSLKPVLRLPALQQLLPALRRMTVAEREELRAVAAELALADRRIDIFECCLALLLESALRQDLERGDEHGSRTLAQSASAIRDLFAILAQQGAADAEQAQRAFAAGVTPVLGREAASYSPPANWPEALRGSLNELAALRPSEKRALVEGLVRTVAHDRRLSVPEGELLRTVSAVLHCPLPPILTAVNAPVAASS